MPWWRRLLLLTIYFALLSVGTWLTYEWISGAKGIVFKTGGFLILLGLYLLWNDFLNPKRERL